MLQDNQILLSIIICTRNRADEIINCLPEVARQAQEFSDIEIIVVDNGSTDNTKEVIANFAEKLNYPFRYVYESVAGLCQARNTGRAAAKGKVLTYIDDDEQIAAGWAEQIREHFLMAKSDCLAGKVGVRLEGEPPFPVEDKMLWFFCATNYGENERFLSYPEHPFGGNMSFKTEVFDAVGGFDTNLKLYGDETNFFRRASEKGFSMFYNPRAEVKQVIPANRLTKDELRQKSYIWGKGAATNWLLSVGGFGQRIAKIVEFSIRTAFMELSSVFGVNFGKFYTLWYNRGYLTQLLKGLEKTQK